MSEAYASREHRLVRGLPTAQKLFVKPAHLDAPQIQRFVANSHRRKTQYLAWHSAAGLTSPSWQ
jgi:hypothetical protein